jgi:hypothetical protein
MNYFVIASLLFATAISHSWLECVDYQTTEYEHYKLGNYDPSKCNAYPRGFERQYSEGFGVDTGFNWAHEYCAFPSSTMKTAVANPGAILYMSHPSKNHVADLGCTNQFIPSNSFNVIVIPKSEGIADKSFERGLKLELIGGDHINGTVDFKGYQRCYQFCDNMDKAHCISGWKIPNDMAPGEYTGLWLWEFNVKEYYSSCFDFTISGDIITPIVNSSNSMSGSGSNTDNVDNTTIQIPKTQTVPTNAPTQTTNTPEPSMANNNTDAPTQTTNTPEPSMANNNTDAPTQTTNTPEPSMTNLNTDSPEPSIDIITSNSPSIISPILTIGKYVLNITGLLNITVGLFQ